MATPKFDRILVEFSKQVKDRLVSAFTPGGGAYPEGTILTAALAINFVNRGLLKYFEMMNQAAEGSIEKFANLCPELISDKTTVAFTTGIHTIVNPNLNFYNFVGGVAGTAQIIRKSPELLDLFLAGKFPLYPPSTDKPYLIQLNTKLYIFPTSITTADIIFIKQPLDKTTGGFIAQNGSEDSPFYDFRNSTIAEIAAEIYWKEKHLERK